MRLSAFCLRIYAATKVRSVCVNSPVYTVQFNRARHGARPEAIPESESKAESESESGFDSGFGIMCSGIGFGVGIV